MTWGCVPSTKVIVIIQARMGAERLPGKVLMDLCGKPMLAHVIDRVKQCKTVYQVVVATPDDEVSKFAYSRGVFGYLDTGDPNNVLLRYIKAGGWSGAQVVVRITADCPLIQPELIDNCVKTFVDGRYDIVTNVLRRSYPKGFDVEVLHYNTLKRIYHLTEDSRYREHVTLFAYENPWLFKIYNVFQNRDQGHISFSVDTQDDLDRVRLVMSKINTEDASTDVTKIYEEIYSGCTRRELRNLSQK